MAMDEEIRSSRIMERIGCAVAFSTSMPMARASTSARSSFAHHELVAQLRRELAQEEERDDHHAQADQSRDDELVLPRLEVVQGVGGHQAGAQGAHGRAERPEPHGDATAHLGREVAHQRRRRDEDDALHEADHAVGRRRSPHLSWMWGMASSWTSATTSVP